MNDSTCDACVVGGGPAGLAAAVALQRQGLQVIVLDRAAPPIDKACGEGLLPDGIRALKELGITLPAGAGFSFQGICFLDGRSSAAAAFPDVPAIALRRTSLHSALICAAEREGAWLRWGVKNVQLSDGSVAVDGRVLKTRWVIGADGQNSQVRLRAGLHLCRIEHRRYGFRRHYRVAPWSSYMELYWGAAYQVYVTPIAADEVCVAVISRDPKVRVDDAIAGFPELQHRICFARPVSREMGALSVTRELKRVYCGRLALIGDASGSVDAITGEGMGLSFRQASALAEALKDGRLRNYQEEHQHLSRRPRSMAALMLAMAKHHGLQRRILKTFSKRPTVLESLLAIHIGDRSFSDLRPRDVFAFSSAFLAG
jgi:flavin-dependent dehydrogenase